MDSEAFSAPYDTDSNWMIAKSFFRELVTTTRTKVRWPGNGEEGSLGGLGKDDRERFDSWRRDAGEVIVGAYVFILTPPPFFHRIVGIELLQSRRRLMLRYYILRDEMLGDLTRLAGEQVAGNAPWQVGLLPCLRFFFIYISVIFLSSIIFILFFQRPSGE